jgi:hypothetical protein
MKIKFEKIISKRINVMSDEAFLLFLNTILVINDKNNKNKNNHNNNNKIIIDKYVNNNSNYRNNKSSYAINTKYLLNIIHHIHMQLFLTYSQAEILLLLLSEYNVLPHIVLVEKILFQIYCPRDVKKFLKRNLYVNEVQKL